MTEDLPPAGPHGAQQVGGGLIGAGVPFQEAHRQGEEGGQRHQRHLGRHAEAHPQHQQGGDGDGGDGLGDHQQGVERPVEHPHPVHQGGQGQGHGNADSQAVGRLLERDGGVGHQGGKVGDQGIPHLGRGGQHKLRHQPSLAGPQPDGHDDGQRGQGGQLTGDAW